MKRSNWLLAVLPCLVATACGDLLTETPQSQIVTGTFFRTEADALAAIAANYEPLTGTDLYRRNLQWAPIAAADYARINPIERNGTIVGLTQMTWDERSPYVTTVWDGFYTVITRANLIIERVPEIAMDEAVRATIVGEAKFLRALSYFYLVRFYGDVPLVLTTEEQLAEAVRDPQEDVFAALLQDAQAAEASLPLSWDAANRGRATRGAAQALQAEVHLWRRQWSEAATAARKVIDSGVYRLEPDYLDAFLPGSQNRREEIFAVQSSGQTGSPQINIAQWTYPREMVPQTAGGWGTYIPLDWFYDSYPEGDYRRDVTYFTEGMSPTGPVTFAPHVHKYRPTARPGEHDVNWPIYRYADVLLMYAEALNEQGATADALTYVNMVRARARNADGSGQRVEPADLPMVGQAELREAIFRERGWEMAFEGKRWFDLVRRGWDYFRTSLERDPTTVTIEEHRMLWPIPQTEIELNAQLTQNPGY